MTEQPIDHLVMRQRLTMMVNRYAFTVGDGGPLVAFAQQKRMAFKEQVTFYADEAKTQPIFSFKARRKLDLGAIYDVFDASGQPIGLRDTYDVTFPAAPNGARMDWRVGACVAVALDALQSR